jgi:hypothetical protein
VDAVKRAEVLYAPLKMEGCKQGCQAGEEVGSLGHFGVVLADKKPGKIPCQAFGFYSTYGC